jgi:hypothetical protein
LLCNLSYKIVPMRIPGYARQAYGQESQETKQHFHCNEFPVFEDSTNSLVEYEIITINKK